VCATFAKAENTCDPEVSRLISAQGHVDAYLAHVSQWSSAQQGQPYCGDDKVRTGALSRAVLSMEKGIATFLALDQLTLLNFVKNAGRVMLSIETGQVHIRSHTPSRFDVTTPFVNAGIEGTEFLVKADEHSAEISVFEGKVRVFNNQGEILITKGQTAQTLAGQAPTLKQIDLKPDDAVRWALYYPPIIDFTTLNSLSNDPHIQLAQIRYESGDVLGAIDQLSLLINRQPTVELMAAQAGLFLTLGRVDSAEYLIHEAEKTQPEHATLKALLAIMALTKNDKDLARQLAQSAVQSNPQSPIPYVALSYVEQAQFNLDLALENIEKALLLASQSGLIYCRKAELLSSKGEISLAKESAEKATTLNPRLGRSQTVLGFMQLMEANIDDANQSFQLAIDIDASDPLTHLGLALVRIRNNELASGIEQLEIAASLDPNDSLIRSYLGKAYYEQNRNSIADLQFNFAKTNDPKDPTPYFYSAIQKQTSNQPIEALREMNEAIELNDNRSVYRSRLLLDQDLAARSVSLARIYTDLGFDKAGYTEASKALLQDPMNFSAHRFLADTYSTMPGHQIARVSEVLQMQLWQPTNITLLQPQLSQTNLGILQTSGISSASFREFNPLFMRDGAYFQTSGLVASNNTYSDDVVATWQHEKIGLSFGQFHSQSDGFRENADYETNIYDALAQVNLSPQTSIQTEYRHNDDAGGETTLIGYPDLNKRRKSEESEMWRIGMHHMFSLNSGIISNYTWQQENIDKQSIYINEIFKNKIFSAEIQYVYKFLNTQLVTGFNHYFNDQEYINKSNTKPTPSNNHINKNDSVYLYMNSQIFERLYLTTAASLDSNKGNFNALKTTRLNPKFGLTWIPNEAVTIRLAAYKSLKSDLLNDQTIQPTQVAGFNQFFDEVNNTESWSFGAGVDQILNDSTRIGYQWTRRQSKMPNYMEPDKYAIPPIENGYIKYENYTEESQRAYINEIFNKNITSSLSYTYIKSNRPNYDTTLLKTNKIALGLSYFESTGLSFNLNPAYYLQSGKYFTESNPNKKSDFLNLDIDIRYRLPNRHGQLIFGVFNLFNNHFNFTTYDPFRPSIFPERILYTEITLSIQ